MERIICLIVGYLCGLIQTGYFYAKHKHVDIKHEGSGNSGATNTMRVMGTKAGLFVFFGDFLKSFIPCIIVRFMFSGSQSDMALIYMLYTGLGVVLGHNFPFYLKFQGGKGIAATAAIIVALDWRIVITCLILFFGIAIITRYVSLASLSIATCLFIESAIFAYHDGYNLSDSARLEFCVLTFVIMILAYYKHRANIVRLIHGNENKFGVKK